MSNPLADPFRYPAPIAFRTQGVSGPDDAKTQSIRRPGLEIGALGRTLMARMLLTALISVCTAGSVWARSDVIAGPTAATTAAQAVLNYQDRRAIFEPRVARYGMVASDHTIASRVGSEVLARGGNASDAAVASAFALAVVLPYAGNLGGGGFALVHQHETNRTLALDFRETAPGSAHPKMFLDQAGQIIARMSIESTASIGVPGSVAGLLAMLETVGTMSRVDVMNPAIELAERGFEVTSTLATLLESHARHLYKSPPNRKIFFKNKAGSFTGIPQCDLISCPFEALQTLQTGDTLVQSDLARTLRLIRDQGAKGFYTGTVAQALVDTVNQGSGEMSLADLENYQPRWREPLRGHYRDISFVSMPAPSSGGVHLIQMLNILSHFPIREMGYASAASLHVMSEAARRAYADRAVFLGDPDFVDVPVSWLTSMDYAQKLASQISVERATPSREVHAGKAPAAEGTQTTHLSVMDQWGNTVSLTTTLNLNFGSGWMATGTGVLLNNEMDDFTSKPGVANAFGLTGSQANRIEAGKRPLSSMTPVIAFQNGEPWFATGSPGGSRIITIVLQVMLNIVDHGMNIAAAGAAPRMHHQWLPDKIDLETGFSPDTIRILQLSGHKVDPSRAAGRVQTVARQTHSRPGWLGASDPRSADGAAIGPDRLNTHDK